MDRTIHEQVESQFSPTAASYAKSAVHADAAALAELVALLRPRPSDTALDVATGAGHLALAIAPHVARVVAFDLTQSMLDQTLASATERGLTNVEVVRGVAEDLPFEKASFDVYTVRLAPHHFADIRATIREAARILKPGGRYLVADTSAPEDDTVDREIHEIEVLRDHSHVRNYGLSEWRTMLEEAGLEVEHAVYGRISDLDLDDWTKRMSTPPENVAELRRRFENASPALTNALLIRREGEQFFFNLPRVVVMAKKP